MITHSLILYFSSRASISLPYLFANKHTYTQTTHTKLEFFAGIAPLASVMDVATKLKFSLEVYDYKKSGRISREELVTVLDAINTTSSYFGDAVLQKSQVAVIVDDLFANELLEDDNAITYVDKVYKMTNHPLMAEFTSGAGQCRYGTAQ